MKTPELHEIKKILGKPYFENKDFLLYNGDCTELMSKLPPNLINTTITSPPYNIGKEYEKIMTVDDYINWCSSWIEQIYNLTKKDGALLLNLGYLEVKDKGRNVPIPYLLWDKTPFYLIQEIIWNYGAGVSCRKILSPRNEKILWYVKDENNYTFNLDPIRDPNVKYPNQKKNGKLRCNPLGKNPSDVWQIAKVTSGSKRSSKERTKHPAQFPNELIDKFVQGFSNPNDIILDPFIGSGTTAEMSLKYGRKCVGFEIREDYCEITVDRIQNSDIYQTTL
ncbi:DNA-methyltransferase [Methanobrevibacter smithii]|uniref:DNA-methyltransferase n=2 Tax=Methanobrevibacter smithii TaxID=2173 RepID=UPI000362B746|nr:site-specific DNA-methyltransferase [Methanobrevibacter smithii]